MCGIAGHFTPDRRAGTGLKPALQFTKARAGYAFQSRVLQQGARRSAVSPRRGEHEHALALARIDPVFRHFRGSAVGSNGLVPPA